MIPRQAYLPGYDEFMPAAVPSTHVSWSNWWNCRQEDKGARNLQHDSTNPSLYIWGNSKTKEHVTKAQTSFLFTWTWLLLDWLIMRSEIHRTHAEKWLKWHNTDSHSCEMFLVTVSRWTPRAERNLQTFRDAGQKAITSGDQEEWSSALPRSVLQIWIGVTKALLNVIWFLFLNLERMSWSVCNIHTEVKQELIACYYDAWTPDLFKFNVGGSFCYYK